MKLKCDVCGKEFETVNSPEELAGISHKQRRWMLVDTNEESKRFVCGGGGVSKDGIEHDKCLGELIDKIGSCDVSVDEVFVPVDGSIPEYAMKHIKVQEAIKTGGL